MPLTRAQKEEIIVGIKQLFADSKVAIFLNFHGLSVKDGTRMRRDFRNQDMRYRVMKKSLLARAIGDLFGKKSPELKGEIGVVFGHDPLAASKETVRVAKAIKALTVQGGWWGNAPVSPPASPTNRGESLGGWIDVRQIVALAAIPSREVLLAQLVMMLNTPMRNMAGALAGIPRKFVGTLEAIKQTKEK